MNGKTCFVGSRFYFFGIIIGENLSYGEVNDMNLREMLTDHERNEIYALNAKYNYTLSSFRLLQMTDEYEQAAKNFDVKTMAKIYARLEDLNFHNENGYLLVGNYQGLRDKVKKEFVEWNLKIPKERPKMAERQKITSIVPSHEENAALVTYTFNRTEGTKSVRYEGQSYVHIPPEKGSLDSMTEAEFTTAATQVFRLTTVPSGDKRDISKVTNPVIRTLYDVAKHAAENGIEQVVLSPVSTKDPKKNSTLLCDLYAQFPDNPLVDSTVNDLLERGVLGYDTEEKRPVCNHLLLDRYYEPYDRSRSKLAWFEQEGKEKNLTYRMEGMTVSVSMTKEEGSQYRYNVTAEEQRSDAPAVTVPKGKFVLPLAVEEVKAYCKDKRLQMEEEAVRKKEKEKELKAGLTDEVKQTIIETAKDVLTRLKYHRVEEDKEGNFVPVATGNYDEMKKQQSNLYRNGVKSFVFLAYHMYQPKDLQPLFRQAIVAAGKENRVVMKDDIVRAAVYEKTGKQKMWYTSHRLYPPSVTMERRSDHKMYRLELTGTEKGIREYVTVPEKWMRTTTTGEKYLSCPVTAVLELERKQKSGGKTEQVIPFEFSERLDLLKNKEHIRPHFERGK